MHQAALVGHGITEASSYGWENTSLPTHKWWVFSFFDVIIKILSAKGAGGWLRLCCILCVFFGYQGVAECISHSKEGMTLYTLCYARVRSCPL